MLKHFFRTNILTSSGDTTVLGLLWNGVREGKNDRHDAVGRLARCTMDWFFRKPKPSESYSANWNWSGDHARDLQSHIYSPGRYLTAPSGTQLLSQQTFKVRRAVSKRTFNISSTSRLISTKVCEHADTLSVCLDVRRNHETCSQESTSIFL